MKDSSLFKCFYAMTTVYLKLKLNAEKAKYSNPRSRNKNYRVTYAINVILYHFPSIIINIMVSKTISLLVILSTFLLYVDAQEGSEYEEQGFNKVKFNFNPNSNIGSNNWDYIDTSKSEYNNYFNQKENTCDGKMQSPVKIKPQTQCQDNHRLHFTVSNHMNCVIFITNKC